MLIVQTPNHLDSPTRRVLEEWAGSGRPLAIFASLATGIDPGLATLAGVSGGGVKPEAASRRTADLGADIGDLSIGIPSSFQLYQPALSSKAAPGTEIVYSVGGSPALTLAARGKAKVVFWDPADLNYEAFPDWLDEPMVERMGSVYPFVLAARTVADALKGSGSPFVEDVDPATPATVLAWKTSDGTYKILAADLEEGLSDAARTPFELRIKFPATWGRGQMHWSTLWSHGSGETANDLGVPLGQAQSELYSMRQ
jgi:hypothetical protein